MTIQTILVLLPVTDAHKKRLEAAAPGISILYGDPDSPGPEIAEADVLVGNIPVRLLAQAKKLQWLQSAGAGVEQFCRPGILPQGVLLSNATGAYGHTVAEHLFAMHLALLKNLQLYRDNQLSGLWRDEGAAGSVRGSTVVVLGLGDIGRRLAEMEHALGGHVIGVNRTLGEKPAYVDELFTSDALDSLLPRADCIVLALPSTAQTSGILDRRRLGLLKKGALILNGGRGSAIDTDALCDALESGQLGGAGLDVTEPEPLPAGHRLWGIPRALITPHASGGFHLPSTLDSIIEVVAENLELVLRGQPPATEVELATGYARKQ